MAKIFPSIFFFSALCSLICALCGCAGVTVSAEEYYSIGMAYFELGKYEEAEEWLLRAKQAKRTMEASAYNLGRLSFEMGRYEEAAKHFESILKKDKDNVQALKAAAYSRIKSGDIEKAEKHYSRLLEIVPESADDGFNHALVLFAMGRHKQSEEVLEKYPIALQENRDVILLYARNQSAQNKVEAIDTYAAFLVLFTDPKARYEYASLLEKRELYARALEEYRKTLTEITADTGEPKKSDVRFSIAKVLLIADSSSGEGISELRGAVNDGFSDISAILLLAGKTSGSNKEAINDIAGNLRTKSETKP